MAGAIVGKIISVDAGDHGVTELELDDGARHVVGLVRIRRVGFAVRDVAIATGAGADIAEDHKGGGAVLAPALPDVRAACFFAHGVQAQSFDERVDLVERLVVADLDAQPCGPTRLLPRPRATELH